jgi:hypothetical protein
LKRLSRSIRARFFLDVGQNGIFQQNRPEAVIRAALPIGGPGLILASLKCYNS